MSATDLHAVIFSGGGADGAYQIGVAKALFNGKSRSTYLEPLDPAVFTGTSIGSFNSSFLVSQWADYGPSAVANLEKVWLERMSWTGPSNGGFRVRLNPFELLDPRPYLKEPFAFRPLRHLATDLGVVGWEGLNRTYNLFASKDPLLERLTDFFNLSTFVAAEPWEKTIQETIDFKKIRQSNKKLSIAATNWAFGEVREFNNGDMTDKLGPAAIRASSSVPGVYPAATVGAQTYVDGAVLMNTPLKPAISGLVDILKDDPNAALWDEPYREAKQKAEEAEAYGQPLDPPDLVLHVIYMNTDVEKMPIDALQSTLQTLYRTQIIGWAAAVNRDILRSSLLNRGIELLNDPERLEKGLTGEQAEVIKASGKALLDKLNSGNPYRPLTIHRYFPPDGLDGALGFLDVRRGRFERLIDEGFHNTVAHDCQANQCVLAGRHKDLALR
ncbi:MAG: patatin-like phospholipase family protein [Acidobacteriota bacterium]